MTTNAHDGAEAAEIPPDELLRARDRMARDRSFAARGIARGSYRRRILPAALVGSALLFTAGIADKFVQSTLQQTVAGATAQSTPLSSSANESALAQVTQTLAADRKAIVALEKAQAQLAHSAGQDGGVASLPSLQLPNLPSIPSIPNIAAPTAVPAPATHATTGASVVVP